jgi:hypothetical protein
MSERVPRQHYSDAVMRRGEWHPRLTATLAQFN